ncbi:MAG TPA: hypothetical protein VKC52_00390 [Acidimicrobiia bacterium]|nr:hypothetical protein [Acidimicrobiia bacterium]
MRRQRSSDGLAKASQSPQNPLADFCIELGYPCLGRLGALAHCVELGYPCLRRLRALAHCVELGYPCLGRLRALAHCVELGYQCLGRLRALAHCIVPRPHLSLFVLALAAKFLELAAKPLERLGVLA